MPMKVGGRRNGPAKAGPYARKGTWGPVQPAHDRDYRAALDVVAGWERRISFCTRQLDVSAA